MNGSRDALAIRNFIDALATDAFVLERTRENVEGPAPDWDQEQFWYVLMGCLLTTQQKSATGSAVSRFLSVKPFPLSLSVCRTNPGYEFVTRVLTDFGGIRFTSKIAWQANDNLKRLENGLWFQVEHLFNQLRAQRKRQPQPADKAAERDAARFVDGHFAGFGPKQSRNLWQWLGITRYEIPLDSRVANWVSKNLSFSIDIPKLGDARYYEARLDRLQAVCAEANVLPCVFDAAAFNDENKPIPEIGRLPSGLQHGRTTLPGFVNVNGQITIRDTAIPGTDHLQRIYQLGCSHCGHVCGANGSDIHERRCPNCQDGAEGLPLSRGTHA